MNKVGNILMICGVVGLLSVSCTNEEDKGEDMLNENAWTKPVSQEVLDAASKLGLNINHLHYDTFHFPDGTTEERLYLEEDITIKEEELISLSKQIKNTKGKGGASGRHYSTRNLVRQGSQISIVGRTGGYYGLTNAEQRGLRMAVENYNNLRLSIRFNLSFRAYGNGDITVYNNRNSRRSGGQAEFPNYGKPGKWIQVYNLGYYSMDMVEHLITHEIGHAIGLRHTDWFDRRSCGENSNEGHGWIGANHISGTPTGRDYSSIMQSCLGRYTSGEFNYNDRRALHTLY